MQESMKILCNSSEFACTFYSALPAWEHQL
jgi:hypothetical protein